MTTPPDSDTAMATPTPRKPEYKLIDAETIDELEKQINALLADGWSVAGGVAVILDRHNDCQGMAIVEWSFHQAMTRL